MEVKTVSPVIYRLGARVRIFHKGIPLIGEKGVITRNFFEGFEIRYPNGGLHTFSHKEYTAEYIK